MVMVFTTPANIFAGNNNYTSYTNATQTKQGKTYKWDEWNINFTPIQMSLSPGADETELNFAWYSKCSEFKSTLKISDNPSMKGAKELKVTTTPATSGFKSNKATATNLKPNTRYYYSYTINGEWTKPTQYKTKLTKRYTFGFVGDPQIGASYQSTEVKQQEVAVRNDSFNWNDTINKIIKRNNDTNFIICAGDQIQSGYKFDEFYVNNEIEYSGFLSPPALKSIPIATTIGNHDSNSPNYSYHFNIPNKSNLGKTLAGSNYYYKYGNTLFIMLNTNNDNIEEHKSFIKYAIEQNKSVKWRIVTMHHDIYGSGKHSNKKSMIKLRNKLVPILQQNEIDLVLSGHDHIYSRTHIIKITNKGETQITNKNAICTTKPDGILYITANSSSGSKYYELASKKQPYIACRWQGYVPTYSLIDVTDKTLTINTYRTDNNKKIDTSFTIVK